MTFLIASLTAVTGLAGAIGGQLVASSRAVKLARLERVGRLEDQVREERRTSYARFLVATRLVPPAAKSADPAVADPALSALREAAAYVELAGPAGFEGLLSRVLDSADRWVMLAGRQGPTSPDAQAAGAEYQGASLELRSRMLAALGR
ncbi:hypothetical protein [Amycolatopsis sp. SID8362]|uniref:hypothetical protein n=1 Tax=Amycolatopsis sp. SID8362 TaxID=2690346 RepID=UPI00136A14EA|nr:hypothetical protein [Amycolatopsis sp. SID8362]